MYKYIINPYNKKKINIKSKLGKKILQNYLKSLGGSSSDQEVDNKNMQELISKIPTEVLEQIIKNINDGGGNIENLIYTLENVIGRLKLVNKKFNNFLNPEKIAEIVLEVKRNYLLQLVEKGSAFKIDENTFLQLGNINPHDWILDESVVEFQNTDTLRKSLEEAKLNIDDIEYIKSINDENTILFRLKDIEEIPGRTDGNRMHRILYNIQVLYPLKMKNGDNLDILLLGIEMNDLKMTGKIVSLDSQLEKVEKRKK